MANNELSQVGSSGRLAVTGDVIGGALLTLLGLVHLFVIEIGGMIGGVLLLIVWPLIAGAIGAYLDPRRDSGTSDLLLVGAIVGVFGAVATVIVVFLLGILGVWSGFIFDTFGVDLVTVTFGMAILFVLTWTVSGFVGGSLVKKAGI